MTRKIIDMDIPGVPYRFTVTRDDQRQSNPYAVYLHYYTYNESDTPALKKHRKLKVRYGDLASCTAYLHQMALKFNQE